MHHLHFTWAAALLVVPSAMASRKYNTHARRVDTPGVLNVHVIPHTHDVRTGSCGAVGGELYE